MKSEPIHLCESDAPRARYARDLCRLYAKIDRPVVLVGPVGVGKTAMAHEIHRLSRRPGRLVQTSSGELTETLFADTLFGHVAGAFTGAVGARAGAFAQAAAGTLLLDDLVVMPAVVQAAILRVAEGRRYRPLGATRDEVLACRLLFTSTEEPRELIARGILLPDLASRLGELVIRVPTLRGRRSDIMRIAHFVASQLRAEHGTRGSVTFSDETRALLQAYSWPSNIRELKAVVERAVIHAGLTESTLVIRPVHLPERLRVFEPTEAVGPGLTTELVERVLREAGGNQSEAARILGVHRNTIARRLRKAR